MVFELRKAADIESAPLDSAVHVHELPAEEACTVEDAMLAVREYRHSRASRLEAGLRRRELSQSTRQHARALRQAAVRLRQQGLQLLRATESCYTRALQIMQR